MKKIYIALLAIVGLSSCFKETAYQTNCIIDTRQQVVSGDEYIPLTGAIAYSFAGTTSQWGIASFDDALNGVATAVAGGATQAALTTSVESGEGRLSLQLEGEEMIIVVVDPESESYAIRDYELPQNLTQLDVTLPFLPWKATTYNVGKWSFVPSEFTSLNFYIESFEQLPDSEEVESLAITKSYIFVAEPEDMVVSSYEDAFNGVATSPSTGLEYLAYASGTPYGDAGNEVLFNFAEPEVLMVVVDEKNSIYAYNRYSLSTTAKATRSTLTFDPSAEDDYTNSGWTYVVLYGNMNLVVQPMSQATEQDEAQSLAGTKCFTFAGTTADLSFSSWEDAVAGVATSASTGLTVEAIGSTGTYGSSSTTLELTLHESLMNVVLLVVDSEGGRYAYSDYTIEQNIEDDEVVVLFNDALTGEYEQGVWHYVVEDIEEGETEPEDSINP